MIIKQHIYNGDLIHQRFAYKFFRENVSPYGNIVVFRSPMEVTDNLIDLEDSLTRDFIYSDDAINICWEIPNLCPKGAVAFQRLYNTYLAFNLQSVLGIPINVKGDDIMTVVPIDPAPIAEEGVPTPTETKKLSVSITYSKDNVAIGHLGININAGSKAPSFAYSTNMTDEQATQFAQTAITVFNETVQDIFIATTKIIG